MVIPSEHEAFGLVVNEAMLCGCPVVASDRVGAVKELIVPTVTGFVFPCGDVKALAQCLKHVLSDELELREVAKRATSRMRFWSPKESIEAMLDAVKKVYDRRKANY